MADANWQKVREVFDAALQQQPEERTSYLKEVCGDNKGLLTEVESLFASLEQSDEFLETPAVAHVADLIEPAAKSLPPGTRFGHYEVISQIGTGGMGEVYLAKDQRLDRHVAIKILNEKYSRDEANLLRFVGEAKAASALNHPNILVIHEIGESEDGHYIVSEFIEGGTLRESLAESPKSLREIIDIAIQIASALSAAHGSHLIHRDIKPENVMVRPDGYVKILDFGLAKLVERENIAFVGDHSATRNQTAQGVILGTVNYMSPEQAKGEPVDERSDIFSLGVVLYEMTTGRLPFAGDSLPETYANLINAEPQPFSNSDSRVSDNLKRIVSKMLLKNKDERYQTMNGLLADLKNVDVEADQNGKGLTTNSAVIAAVETIQHSAMHTADTGVGRSKLIAEYLINEIARHRRVALLALAFVVLAIASAAYFFNAASGGETLDSVAVLPFINTSGDPNTAYLSEGLSDSIINRLSRLPNLKVRQLSEVLSYKGNQVDVQSVGRELNVRAVLSGRITRQGNELTISTKLVDVRDNRILWGEQYNRKLSDILVIQDDIAREITRGMRLQLTGAEKQQLAKQYTDNNDAYLLYNEGKHYFRQNTKESFEKSIDAFEQAIKLDPNYALAYAGLALTYQFMGTRAFAPPQEFVQRVELNALRALQIDDTLAEAHVFLAMNKVNKFDWLGAEKESKRAMDLDPNSSGANDVYAIYLSATKGEDAALPYAIRARELDPGSPGQDAFPYFLARQYDKAIELYRKALEKRPDNAHAHILLGEAYAANGNANEGVAEMEKGVALDKELSKNPERWDRYPLLSYAYAMAGRRVEALKILDEQQRLAKQRYVSPYNFAIIYTGLGDKDRAFEWLTKCVEEHTLILFHLKSRPLFDSLRSDPRYADLLRRMNLEP